MAKYKIRKILLVEDNPGYSIAIKLLLERKGYAICTANNEMDAATMATNEKFDLILMDYQMPLMDGIRSAKLIRETDKEVIIISISLRNDDEYIDECRACGMNGHIPKGSIIKAIENSPFETVFDFLNDDDGTIKEPAVKIS